MIEDNLLEIKQDKLLSKKRRCGFYVRNPYAYGLHEKLDIVPLKNIDYQLEIVNSLLSVTLIQTYENPLDKFL